MTVCPDCDMTPSDPEGHKVFHDRIRALMEKSRRRSVMRPVSSDERREQEEDGA